MANKWEITLDVTEDEATLLAMALRYVAKEKPARNEELYILVEKIELAWVEREVEIIPPPSQWL